MKKLLLSLGLVFVGSTAMSQVIFSVEAPASIQGFYDFTSNGNGSNWGLATLAGFTPILDTVVMANDGTPGLNAQGNPASATGCNAFTLPAQSLAGKIAMIYRGDGTDPGIGACGFGLKAKMCQNAGAIAVIIVNREDQLLNMDGGTVANEGLSVNIPVVFVSHATGTLIKNRLLASETVTALIGDKTGYYDDDITTFDNSSVRPNFGSKPLALTQNASEFSLSPGTWVYNYGINNQNGVTLNTTITRNGSGIYNETSTSMNIPSGDSVFMTTPTYSATSYTAGQYKVIYTISMPVTDEFSGDNVSVNYFDISDSLWSLVHLDPAPGKVVAKDGYYRLRELPSSTFETCVVLKDPHASRIAMDGIYFGGFSLNSADTETVSLDGFEVLWTLYTWDDGNKTIAGGTFNAFSSVADGGYIFPEPATTLGETTIFMPINGNPYRFIDNKDYVLCVNSVTPELYMAFSTNDYYDLQIKNDNLIRFPFRADNAAFVNQGFGISPSIAIRTGATLNVTENELVSASAFPVPAKEVITVKVKAVGDATLKIVDMAGRTVSTQQVKIENGEFQTSVEGMNSGTYVFSLDYSNGTTSRFNVVVSK